MRARSYAGANAFAHSAHVHALTRSTNINP
jgi:hypothetical protein